jgi:plastocyanin
MKRLMILLALCLATAAAAFAVPALATIRTVSVKDDFYGSRSKSVSKNTTVRWVWRGSGRHNVVVDSGPVHFHSTIKRSGTFSHRFTRRGRYHIICTVHSEMTMTVHVN